MSAKHDTFARTVLAAFKENGLHTDDAVKEAGGPSDTYMGTLRRAVDGEPMRSIRSDTAGRIDAAAGWTPGSAMQFFYEGELPARHRSRPAAPAALADIHRTATGVERDDAGERVVTYESWARLPVGESHLEVRYRPGPGRDIEAIELIAAAAGVHRAAISATYLLEEGGGAHDSAVANQPPDPGPAKQPGKSDDPPGAPSLEVVVDEPLAANDPKGDKYQQPPGAPEDES